MRWSMLALLAASVTAHDAQMPGAANDWPLHGRTFNEERFSPLQGIDTSNVAQLGLAFSFDAFVVRGRTHRGNEASPIVVDGVIYFAGPWSVVYAVDARTGKALWTHDPQVAGAWARVACCDAVNRGVAVWKGVVYVAALDGFLIALDAKSGKRLWRVDTLTDRVTMNYASTGAPRIAGNNVVIGNSGADMGARGYVSAYDLATGKLAWRFFTVPGDPAKGPDESPDVTLARRTWSKQSRWDLGGGGTVWDSMVYDPELGLLYLGTGNGSPHPVWIRSPGGGDNLFLASIVALDAATGRMRWYYQTTPGDSWDYTATQNMILADLLVGGRKRQVIMQAPKNGFFYVLDRASGELLSAQPYTTVTWARSVNLKTGRPEVTPQSDFSREQKLIWPSMYGGHGWMPMSYSTQSRLVYIPVTEMPLIFGSVSADSVRFRHGAVNEGDTAALADSSTDPALLRGQPAPVMQSRVVAWDPVAQKVRWKTDARSSWFGGTLSTAGNLVFAGSADGSFNAYDATSGKVLKRIETGTAILAAPVSYELDGVQYVAVLAGYGGAWLRLYQEDSAPRRYENRARLLVFKVGGGSVPLPPARALVQRHALPAQITSDERTLKHGEQLFLDRCVICHAWRGQPESGYPDLWNLPPATHQLFDTILLKGVYEFAGMASFADALSQGDVRAIHAYLIADAQALRRGKP